MTTRANASRSSRAAVDPHAGEQDIRSSSDDGLDGPRPTMVCRRNWFGRAGSVGKRDAERRRKNPVPAKSALF